LRKFFYYTITLLVVAIVVAYGGFRLAKWGYSKISSFFPTKSEIVATPEIRKAIPVESATPQIRKAISVRHRTRKP
jgi:hypothetical protein